jgi:hypothetical protein
MSEMPQELSTACEHQDPLPTVHKLRLELTDARDQQTAANEILRVISISPTNTQPVFDAIAESAVRVCGGLLGRVYRFDGKLIHFVAHHNWTAEGLAAVCRVYPRPLSRDTQVATAILDRTVAHVADFDDPQRAGTISDPHASIGLSKHTRSANRPSWSSNWGNCGSARGDWAVLGEPNQFA